MNLPLKNKAGMALKIAVAVSLLCVLLLLANSKAVPAQHAANQPSALNHSATPELQSVLIEEIKQLRLALQDHAATNFRIQIALERMRFQQMLVERSEREIASLQTEIEKAQLSYQSMDESAKSIEKQLAVESNPVRRMELERELKSLVLSAEQHRQTETSCRERNIQAATQLQADKRMLSDLISSVDQMAKTFSETTSQRK